MDYSTDIIAHKMTLWLPNKRPDTATAYVIRALFHERGEGHEHRAPSPLQKPTPSFATHSALSVIAPDCAGFRLARTRNPANIPLSIPIPKHFFGAKISPLAPFISAMGAHLSYP